MDENKNTGETYQVPPNMSAPQSGASGSLVALIVILALLIVGALYFWKERDNYLEMEDRSLDAITTQSSSDMEADIEADLNATDINNVDYDLDPNNFTSS